jgi:hypothetical protein
MTIGYQFSNKNANLIAAAALALAENAEPASYMRLLPEHITGTAQVRASS